MKVTNQQTKKTIGRIALVSVIALFSMTQTACTDTDLALGAGIIIGAAIGSHSDHDHEHFRRHETRPCYTRCGDYHRRHSIELEAINTITSQEEASALSIGASEAPSAEQTKALMQIQSAAEHFNVAPKQAEAILSVLSEVESGNTEAISNLGFNISDLRAMAAGENPSASALKNLSQLLNVDLGSAHSIIQQMKLDLHQAR